MRDDSASAGAPVGYLDPTVHPRQAGQRVIDVFVHMARDKDADAWHRRWRAGDLVGVNDPTPYGYGRAEAMGCRVRFSTSRRENPLETLLRLGLRALTGFDPVHAFRQRRALRAADVVWTHTESQFLAVAAVLPRRGGPKVIAQSVWLFDRWEGLHPLHRWLYTRLIRRLDVLTFLSPVNMAVAQAAFPEKACRFVPFGIPSERMLEVGPRRRARLTVVAPGNDRHRDWAILVEAASALPDARVTILSMTAPKRLARGRAGVRIKVAESNEELNGHLAGASVVCVPLKPNRHASGITVIQEAVLAGVPVVATRTGGLDAYFGPDEIRFVEAGDAGALREALAEIARDPSGAAARARRAQERMRRDHLGAQSYVARHVALSRELLGRA
ncbi:glycosyltransferase [Methylobacterium aerolatum]|uniref:Glycosyltransferase involved in cell wall biosynthesis n=1 Tax=Methylobacterium aerolatum TaxID=418708 RepID=A0ABU0I4Z2_9HYPH|nr:glycosyltransferase [Methylobacterium aerolatum]MDQ0449692.1 glycosyltransferase involved in cell wall biosynthesis [Methylobacterium aerolatum]GJD36020.1 hypothetical protein FMGBMHLM_2934 [Methylobacterium aerolatum]